MLVSDIMGEFILCLDIMTVFGFFVDLHSKVLFIGSEEILLSVHNLKTKKITLIMTDDTLTKIVKAHSPQKMLDLVGSGFV